MPTINKLARLRAAHREVEEALDRLDGIDAVDVLVGIEIQLAYYANGDTRDHEPEAQVAPDPHSLRTIRSTVASVASSVDDDDARAHLNRACEELDAVVSALDDDLRSQHETSYLE